MGERREKKVGTRKKTRDPDLKFVNSVRGNPVFRFESLLLVLRRKAK